jgi:hypothetical protein
MSTKQPKSHGSSIARTDNLVNANSVDGVYVYRDGDQLAISSPVQTAEFELDDLVMIYEGQMDVFYQVFESAGQIVDFWWTPSGCSMVIHSGRERHTVQFVLRQEAGERL